MDIHFILWGISQYYKSLLLKFFQLWPLEVLWRTPIILFFKHFLIFWPSKMFQGHLVYSLPWPQIQPFLQKAPFLLLENGMRNQVLDAWISLFLIYKNNFIWHNLILTQFYRWGNWSWERFSNLLKVSKLKVSEPSDHQKIKLPF